MNYFVQMNVDALAAMPAAQRAFIESRLEWATGGFGVAVFTGVLGCVLLLLRRSFALHVFIASLIGVAAQSTPYLRTTGAVIDPERNF